MGHWAYPKKGINENQGNQKQANPKAHLGYVHYTTVEEILAGEVVTAGMFLVNKHPQLFYLILELRIHL